jgi:uncharacterized protein YbjT (DUF2867 family)
MEAPAVKVLVTGATGYVGGRLVPRLLERGHDVRVLVRDARRIGGRDWADRVEVVEGDIADPRCAQDAVRGMDAAYYLVHSMGGRGDFEALDREAAENFVAAGHALRHVIYLGGLVPDGPKVSKHLRSRAEVGSILRAGLPTTEFRAGPIIGSGSASFEMVRYLTERLPVMVAPKWVRNEVRPIAVRDMLSYLLGALDREPLGILDVGAEPKAFIDMMKEYASVRGYRRWIIPVPVLAPGLAARWVGLVTPITNRLAVPLVRGVVSPLIGNTDRARDVFPDIEPMAYRESVRLALERTERGEVETRWTGALSEDATFDTGDWEGTIREIRSLTTQAPPQHLFDAFSSLGGDKGWLFWDWAWDLRGALDQLIGGPGVRRGRRDPQVLLVGDTVDFWRVESVEAPNHLRLRAEMKVPGKARLQWEIHREGATTRLVQTALFSPAGLTGLLYWYILYPVHRIMFSGLIRAIVRNAEKLSSQRSS